MLPNKRQEAVPDTLFVFCVSREAFFKNGFLVFDAFGYNGNVAQHYYEGYRRGKDQGHRKEKDCSCHIHRMAYYSVQTGVYDFLVLLDFDCAGKVGVLTEDFGVQQI